MSLDQETKFVLIPWYANPFRGDKFEEAWAPAAAAVTKYGARAWAFSRSTDDPLSFLQVAVFDTKLDFERYWYSDEIAEARVAVGGWYQVPLIPTWHKTVGHGVISELINGLEVA